MHIQLNSENKNKLLRASKELNRSVSEIVNTILTQIETIEFSQTFEIKKNENLKLPDNPKIQQKKFNSNWKIKF